MSPDEQQRVQQQMRPWAELTPDQRRGRARAVQVDEDACRPEKKQEVRQKWQEYQSLPPETKRELAAKPPRRRASASGGAGGSRRAGRPARARPAPAPSGQSAGPADTAPAPRYAAGADADRPGTAMPRAAAGPLAPAARRPPAGHRRRCSAPRVAARGGSRRSPTKVCCSARCCSAGLPAGAVRLAGSRRIGAGRRCRSRRCRPGCRCSRAVRVGALYFCWSWTGGRRTLPMKTWRLRLTRRDGAPSTAGRR